MYVQACLSRIYRMPAFPSVFSPLRSEKGMDGPAINFFFWEKVLMQRGLKKGEGKRRETMPDTQPASIPFSSSSFPCHSFPSHFLQSIFSLPPSFGPVSSSPLPPPPPLFPYRGVNRMRYSRLGEREETEEEDRRWMDGRGMVGSEKITNYTGRNNLQLVLK